MRRFAGILLTLVSGLLGCSPDAAAPRGDPGLSVMAGKAPSATDMTVTSALPDSATQDTTLDVAINGSGFVAGTSASWALAGVPNPSEVRTNSTRYVSSRKLIANITISASASPAKWDIVVAAAGKKGGIGSEAFTVKTHRNQQIVTQANLVWDDTVNVAPAGQPPVWQKALLTGDYRGLHGSPLLDGSAGEYQHGFCGSESLMQAQGMSYPEAALNFEVDHGYIAASMDVPCGGKRYYQVYFSGRANPSVHVMPQHYVLLLGTFAVGETRLQEVHFGIQQPNCNALHYNDVYPPANNVRVTRLTDTLVSSGTERRWRVESQGSHRAMCTLFTNKGPKPVTTFYLPFTYTIREIHPPFPHFP